MSEFVEPLLYGLLNTLKLTFVAFALSLIAGLALALCRLSRNRLLSVPAAVYIEIMRSIPALALVFWAYYVLPILAGVRFTPWLALVIALTALSSAFLAETFRSGINMVHPSQWEASKALGMSHFALMRRIVLPQAVMRIMPMLLERFVELMKHSTIAMIIAYPDILHVAEGLALRTYRSLEVFSLTALMFFVVLFSLSRLCALLEKRMTRHELQAGER